MRIFLSRSLARKLIHPIQQGKEFLGGWVLSSLDEDDELVSLEFRHTTGIQITVLLTPARLDVPHMFATKTTKIAVKAHSPLNKETKTFLAAIKNLVERNEARLGERVWLKPPPVLSAVERAREVDLCISTACQNDCVFCTDRPHPWRYLSTDEVKRQISELATQGIGALEFTSLEPTLRPDLVELVHFAHDSGIPSVRIVTNGIRTANLEYLKQLVNAGLNRITLSVHSHTADLEATITRNPNAFQEKLRSLQNIKSLRDQGIKLEFFTNTVIHSLNKDVLADTARFLAAFAPDEIDFYFVYPHGRALANFEAVVPRISELAKPLHELVETAAELAAPIMLIDLPPCALPVQVKSHFRHKRTTYIAISVASTVRLVKSVADFAADRTKPKSCQRCLLFDSCDGIWTEYIKRYGADELTPITQQMNSKTKR